MRGPSAAWARTGSMQRRSGSMSTPTGIAPIWETAIQVAIAVMAGTSTSSPGPTPTARSASASASVPLAMPTAWLVEQRAAHSRSNASTSSPRM